MANIYTGLALAAWVAKAAAKSKAYKIRADGTVVFRMHISVGIYGFIGTLGTAACALIPDTAAMLLMMAIIGPLFVPFFLYYLFARLYVNDEKIAYRNPMGLRREIAWKDLNAAVSIGITGDLVLCGGGRQIRLYPYFCGFPYVRELMHKYRPEAFDAEYMLAHAAEFKSAGGRITFHWRKGFRTLALIIFAYSCAFLMLPNSMFDPMWNSRFVAKLLTDAILILPALVLFIPYVNARLYLDDEKIVHRNALGMKKQVRWEDVESYRIIEKGLYMYIRIHYGHKKKMSIGGEFFGYELIRHIIRKIGTERRIRFW